MDTKFDVILLNLWAKSKLYHFFSPSGEKSDVMVTSFIVKEGSETILHLGSDSLIDELYSILHKTRINRGNRYRKNDLCIKGFSENKNIRKL